MSRTTTGRLQTPQLLAWLAPLLTGCVLSPMPEPPQATIDVDQVVTGGTYGPTITGGPGAVSSAPRDAVVRAFNLDTEADPAEALVAADGSFEIELLTAPGQEVRFQVVASEQRSEPVDVVVGPEGSSPALAVRPLAGCLQLEPAAVLDLAESSSVLVSNRCDQEVRIEQPALRRALAGIDLGPDLAWPVQLATGDDVAVEVQVEAGFATEDVFFIEASAPVEDRRPITVIPPPE